MAKTVGKRHGCCSGLIVQFFPVVGTNQYKTDVVRDHDIVCSISETIQVNKTERHDRRLPLDGYGWP